MGNAQALSEDRLLAALFVRLAAAAVAAFGVTVSSSHSTVGTAMPAQAIVNCNVDMSQMPMTADEQALIDDINAYRLANGAPALQPSFALTRNALWKATDMAVYSYAAHDDGFRTVEERFLDCGYDFAGAAYGENLGGGWSQAAPEAMLAGWEASPNHNATLLDPEYVAIGLKRVQSPYPDDRYGFYWALELGSVPDLGLAAGLAAQQTQSGVLPLAGSPSGS